METDLRAQQEARLAIYNEIDHERARQDAKWGWIGAPTSILPGDDEWKKYAVLGEEFGEVGKALLEDEPIEALEAELVQVAAVAVAWLEAARIKRAQRERERLPIRETMVDDLPRCFGAAPAHDWGAFPLSSPMPVLRDDTPMYAMFRGQRWRVARIMAGDLARIVKDEDTAMPSMKVVRMTELEPWIGER